MDDLFGLFTNRLDAAGVEAMVTGSVAAMVYGEPRLTNDIDIVVALPVASIPALVAAFPLDLFYCAPADVIRVEVLRGHRGHFNIIHHDTGFKADVYIAGRDPLHAWALGRARRLVFGATAMRVAPPEYVIVRKLEFFREGHSAKHVDDIRRMVESLGDGLDLEQVMTFVEARGLGDTWSRVMGAAS
jgi:hypothetical protein